MDNKCAKHDSSIHVSARAEFKERLVREADEAGVSISSYVKHVLLEKWDSRAAINNINITSKVNERPYVGGKVGDNVEWQALE